MGFVDVLVFLVILLGFGFFGTVLFFIKRNRKKADVEALKRCTVPLQGFLVRIEHDPTYNHEHWRHRPVVRYEFGGQVYEKKFISAHENDWNWVKPERQLTIYVNPNDAEEIYVPLPDDYNAGKKRKIILFLVILFIAAMLGMLLTILEG